MRLGVRRIRLRSRAGVISRVNEWKMKKEEEEKREKEREAEQKSRDWLISQIKEDCFVRGMNPEGVRRSLSLKVKTFYDLFVIAQEQDKNEGP